MKSSPLLASVYPARPYTVSVVMGKEVLPSPSLDHQLSPPPWPPAEPMPLPLPKYPVPNPGTIISSSSSCPLVSVISGGFSPPPENTDDASPGRSRDQKRVV